LNQGHACGHNLASRPSSPAPRRFPIRWLLVLSASHQCFACLLDVEAEPRLWSIPKAHASQPFGIRVDPVAGDAELLGQASSIDQANVRTCGRHELSDVLSHRLDLLGVQRLEAPTTRSKEFDLPRNNESEI